MVHARGLPNRCSLYPSPSCLSPSRTIGARLHWFTLEKGRAFAFLVLTRLVRVHPTKGPSVGVLARLASPRRVPPPSKPGRVSLAGTLWDGPGAIPSRWLPAGPGGP